VQSAVPLPVAIVLLIQKLECDTAMPPVLVVELFPYNVLPVTASEPPWVSSMAPPPLVPELL
jgi:hypothetical protein